MTLRCIIVDDEPLGRQVIEEYLGHHNDVEIIASLGDPTIALQSIDEEKPDLLFLDIQMPELTGFDLLKSLQHRPVTIFSTAYDHYAIQAFDENAVDYLLKPFDQERFDKALEKARQAATEAQSDPRMDQLLNYLEQKTTAPLHRIAVRKDDHLRLIRTEDVLWFEALEDYVKIHTAEGGYLISQRMGEMANRLDSGRFVRIHRSIIVNLDAVKEVHPWSSGRFLLILSDKTELETSKSGAKLIRDMML